MTMNTNTTTNTALTLNELRANRTAQTKAVSIDYIKANKDRDQWHYEQYLELKQEEMYQEAEKAVFIALRARHEKSPTEFLTALQNEQVNDTQARNNRNIAQCITNLEKKHTKTKALYNEYIKRANLTYLTDKERTENFEKSLELKPQLAQITQGINDLYDTLDLTLSDRADLVQTALVKMLELEQEPAEITDKQYQEYLNENNKTDIDLTEQDFEILQATANFRAVINSVGRAISTLATPQALNRTTTKAEQIDLETVADYMIKYGIKDQDGNCTLEGVKIPHTTKRASASDCYITIEYRDTKTQKGYYKVTHYRTVAPYQYIESYTQDENGESDIAYLKSYNPFVSTFGDIERIEQLTERANLTERQKLFLHHFANRCRYDGDFKAVKQYAFSKIGITTATNQSTFFNRLKKALNTATK